MGFRELREALQVLPVPDGEEAFTDEDVEQILDEMDGNLDAAIDFHEFTNWVLRGGFGSRAVMQRMNMPQVSLFQISRGASDPALLQEEGPFTIREDRKSGDSTGKLPNLLSEKVQH